MLVSWNSSTKLAFIALSTSLGVGIIAMAAFIYSYQDSIYPRVSVNGLDIGSQNLKKAFQSLKTEAGTITDTPIIFSHNGQEMSYTLTELGLQLDPEETLIKAYKIKREGRFFQGLSRLFQPVEVDWVYSLDSQNLKSILVDPIQPSLQRIKNAQLSYENGRIVILPEQAGEVVNLEKLQELIVEDLSSKPRKITLPLKHEPALVTSKSWEGKKKELEALLTPHRLFFQDKELIIPVEEIAQWLQLEESSKELSLNSEEIRAYLESIQKNISGQPVNAKVRFDPETQQLQILQKGKDGTSLMVEESANRIRDNILNQISQTELFVAVTAPTIDDTQLDSLGIKTLLGRGESNFKGSSRSRIANINVAANKISSTLVKPGEEFSFVKTLGKVDARSGYLPELVIKGNKTIPEYGGGICQVSTTLFRAALNAALPITERRNHSYVVNYYGRPGLDATIYLPKPDFRFKNDTNHHILIQHYITGTILYYEIYGTATGRTAKTLEPVILESKADGSMKTVAYRELYQDGNLIQKDEFYSSYRPPNKVTSNPLQ